MEKVVAKLEIVEKLFVKIVFLKFTIRLNCLDHFFYTMVKLRMVNFQKQKVLIASQPTRGVDIGASEYIHKLLLEYREGAEAEAPVFESRETDGFLENKQTIQQELLDQRCEGTATLLISEDLDEIIALADRIAVIYEGEIMGIVKRDEATIEELGLMMAGERR